MASEQTFFLVLRSETVVTFVEPLRLIDGGDH